MPEAAGVGAGVASNIPSESWVRGAPLAVRLAVEVVAEIGSRAGCGCGARGEAQRAIRGWSRLLSGGAHDNGAHERAVMGDLDLDREGDAWMETDRGEGCVAVFAIVVGLTEQVEKLSVVVGANDVADMGRDCLCELRAGEKHGVGNMHPGHISEAVDDASSFGANMIGGKRIRCEDQDLAAFVSGHGEDESTVVSEFLDESARNNARRRDSDGIRGKVAGDGEVDVILSPFFEGDFEMLGDVGSRSGRGARGGFDWGRKFRL